MPHVDQDCNAGVLNPRAQGKEAALLMQSIAKDIVTALKRDG